MDRIYSDSMDIFNTKINKLQKIQKTIKLLDKKYNNKLVHTSPTSLKISDLFDKNNINYSRVTEYDGSISKIYDNPYGLWYHVVQVG